jgi:hypothetical protein
VFSWLGKELKVCLIEGRKGEAGGRREEKKAGGKRQEAGDRREKGTGSRV